LADIVEVSGLGLGAMPADLLDDLMTSTETSEAGLVRVLARDARRRSTAAGRAAGDGDGDGDGDGVNAPDGGGVTTAGGS
jgi:hypothetical protein